MKQEKKKMIPISKVAGAKDEVEANIKRSNTNNSPNQGIHEFHKRIKVSTKESAIKQKVGLAPVVVTATIPTDIVTYISLKFTQREFFNVIRNKFKELTFIGIDGSQLYAKTDAITKKIHDEDNLLEFDCDRSKSDIYSTDELGATLKSFLASEKCYEKDGEPAILLNASKIISNLLIINQIADADIFNYTNVGKVEYAGGHVFFPLIINAPVGISHELTIPSNRITAANFSTNIYRFEELAVDMLSMIRPNTEMKWVNTSKVLNNQTKNLILSKEGASTLRVPLIELRDNTPEEIAKMKEFKIEPIELFKKSEPMGPGLPAPNPEVNKDNVKLIFSELFTGEPVIFKGSKFFLCPNIKHLILMVLFNTINAGFKVNSMTSTTDISFVIETIV